MLWLQRPNRSSRPSKPAKPLITLAPGAWGPARSRGDRSQLPNRAPEGERTFSAPRRPYGHKPAGLFFLSPCRATELSRVRRLGSGEAAVQGFRAHSAGSRRFAGTAHPLYGRKTASGHFQCGKRSWLWRAVWSRPSMTRSRPLPVSAMPRRALLPPTIDCHRRHPDGRLCHRNRPFVLVGATGWVCPEPAIRGGKGEPPSRVEWGSGAAAVGWACLFPPLSSGGALVARP